MEARARLRLWIEKSELTQRAAAQIFGMHYTFLNQILQGRRLPALANAVRIERHTGISAGAWLPTRDGELTNQASGKSRKRKVA